MPTMEKTKRLKPTNQKANRIFPAESWRGLLRYLPPAFSFRGSRLGTARPISGVRPSRREGRPSTLGRLIRGLGGIFSKGKDRCERPSVGKGNRSRREIRGWGNLADIWLRDLYRSDDLRGRMSGECVLEKIAGLDGLVWMRRDRRLQNIAVR